MKYRTESELRNFDFSESVISEIKYMNGIFKLLLDNVTILPECSCNRDIRQMRANQFLLTIVNPVIVKFFEESYKRYDANGVLLEEVDEKIIKVENYGELLKSFADGEVFSIKKEGETYIFLVDSEQNCYEIDVKGTDDIEEWDRFLNKN